MMMTVFTAMKAAIFATAFMGAWFWVIQQIRPISRAWDGILPASLIAPGVVLAAAGASLAILCVAIFVVRGRGTPALFDAPRRFVAVGPYRHVRNPMYLGGLALFAGFGLYTRSVAVLVFALLWFFLVHAVVLLIEEPGLRRRFGQPYEDYCRQVGRWIPKVAIP